MSRAVGVLGGAFNPPHLGHLLLAQAAIESLELDEIVLVPTGIAPHKRIDPEPGAKLRLEMVGRAVADEERMRASALEVDRDGPSFAYRTLELLADELPGSDLTFVMGADVAAGLRDWRRPERVLELARIAIAERPGLAHSDVDPVLAKLGARSGAAVVEMPALDVSSSMIRERIAKGRAVRWLVPDPVADLIAEHGLYGAGSPAAPAGARSSR
ncbi:MAG: nicotinate (nicotinamide) nucleotide adenylyltransferase [Solirubrobacterales bacterium]|nr:nicotinate (nicotinamide) nucleotide adenylyltransferase [Solirubrobacterales bacterium]